MNCDECQYRVNPFNYCRYHKWALKDKHTEIRGCNIDGALPSLPVLVPPRGCKDV